MSANPYEVPETTREAAYAALGPSAAHAAGDSHGDAPYAPVAGTGAPKFGEMFGAGTDAHRLGSVRQRDMRPNPVRAPEEHYSRLGADIASRHAVEDIDADGWTEQKGGSGKRAAPNPRATPPPETRPTMQMAPRSYFFTRPFDMHSARSFNGLHFSMADHRREYEILGMAPVRTGRNTYRLEPPPWDENVVDLPPSATPQMPSGRIRAVDIPPQNSGSYRLM